MNIELSVIEVLIAVSAIVIMVLLVALRSSKQYNDRIMWLHQQLNKRDATIKELNDRLMSKSFDQYKMYEQPITEQPEPELEEFFDESAVGKISGKEQILDA